jgi:predicted DNA-binding antitoxin AbrB/MazE fold protein
MLQSGCIQLTLTGERRIVMPIATTASFESGMLKPTEPLSLPEHSIVHLVIASSGELDRISHRSRQIAEALDRWLDHSEAEVVSAPVEDANSLAHLDDELDRLLDEIDRKTSHLSEEEIESLADDAVEAMRGAG